MGDYDDADDDEGGKELCAHGNLIDETCDECIAEFWSLNDIIDKAGDNQ